MVEILKISHVTRKPDFCIGENKDADQGVVIAKLINAFVCATQDSKISLLLKSEITSF